MKFTLSLLSLFLSLFLSTNPAFAAGQNREWGPEFHEVTATGIPDNQGRYIKNAYRNEVRCWTAGTRYGTSRVAGRFYSDQYQICTSSSGKKCESVGIDNFTFVQQGNAKIADPKYYVIDISAKVSQKYRACKISQKQNDNHWHQD